MILLLQVDFLRQRPHRVSTPHSLFLRKKEREKRDKEENTLVVGTLCSLNRIFKILKSKIKRLTRKDFLGRDNGSFILFYFVFVLMFNFKKYL